MRLLTNPDQLQHWRDALPHDAVVFVPTMGGLHEGHASLVRRGVEEARRRGPGPGCIVSVFVNPTQFDDPADLARYPRTLDADADLCAHAGADALWAPGAEAVFPKQDPPPQPELPPQAIDKGLEDAFRPGHFAGVCRVVRRLFDLVRPAAAVFGEKDWQQYRVIDTMTQRDGLGVEIIPSPTIRESDGLAMSSRNRFLEPEDRARAAALARALREGGDRSDPHAAERAMRDVLREAGLSIDYACVRDARSLNLPSPGEPARAIIAARLGAVRLLDNAPWPTPAGEPGPNDPRALL